MSPLGKGGFRGVLKSRPIHTPAKKGRKFNSLLQHFLFLILVYILKFCFHYFFFRSLCA
jgi:hypothetical protein